jgi:hypothetical protein
LDSSRHGRQAKTDVERSKFDVPGYARGKAEDLAEILANATDAPPAPGDERK